MVSGNPASAGAMPDVSVLLITYNHAPFVRAAADSVLAQVTPRSVELIISEDASSDGTRGIVEDIAARDPRVRLLQSPRNLRSNETVARAIRAARGRYLCLLDGDDHWIATDKIERQASLLDADPDVAACFHNALIVRGQDETPGEARWTPATQPPRIGLAELWEGNPFATAAGMLRRDALDCLGDWYADCFPITDWPLYLLCAEHGDLRFVDEPVAAYRLHAGGAMAGLPGADRQRQIARFYRRMMRVDGGRWAASARRGGARYFDAWARDYGAAGERDLARLCARIALGIGGVAQPGGARRALGLLRRSVA